MQFFYEEQLHRMECMAQEPVLFEDILCQIIDMIGPEVCPFQFCDFPDFIFFCLVSFRILVFDTSFLYVEGTNMLKKIGLSCPSVLALLGSS